MTGADIIIVALGVMSPWVGLIVLVVMHAHSAERIDVLEREVVAVREKVEGLTRDLGWKQE